MDKIGATNLQVLLGKLITMLTPNKPKIDLENYLLSLVEKSDRKESSIYINGIHPIIQKIWEDIVSSGKRKEVIKELPVHANSIYGYKNGKKNISIQLLWKLINLWIVHCEKDESEKDKLWDDIFRKNSGFSVSSGSNKTTLPKSITPKLSYFIGWMIGDGHLSDKENHYLIKISEKSVPQLENVLKPIIKSLFSINPPIFRRYKKGYAIQFGSKPLFRFLKNVLKIENGKIPLLVEKLDQENLSYFIRGILDSDGCIHKNRPRISIIQSSKQFLLQLGRLLEKLDIDWNGPTLHKGKLGNWYTIKIEGKKNYEKFSQKVSSGHLDKLTRIAEGVST